jgi:hypothetical protein
VAGPDVEEFGGGGAAPGAAGAAGRRRVGGAELKEMCMPEREVLAEEVALRLKELEGSHTTRHVITRSYQLVPCAGYLANFWNEVMQNDECFDLSHGI